MGVAALRARGAYRSERHAVLCGAQGMLLHALLALAGASGLLITYTILIVLRLAPWWEPQFVIPIFGMLLGNTTSAVSVGLSTTLDDLAQSEQGRAGRSCTSLHRGAPLRTSTHVSPGLVRPACT